MTVAKEPRAETTRRAIIESAALSFVERGYVHSSLNEMCARAGVTKGAMYFHFTTKDDLAQTLITEYSRKLGEVFERTLVSSRPGLECLMDWTFTSLKVLSRDIVARAGARMLLEVGPTTGLAEDFLDEFTTIFVENLSAAVDEGDIVTDLDVAKVAKNLVIQLMGFIAIGAPSGGKTEGLVESMGVWWTLSFAALVPEPRRPYFAEYLRRRSEWARVDLTT